MTDKKDKPIKHNKHLSPKQRAFVHNYVDPESDTYSNMTKSCMKAYNYDNRSTASSIGTRLLKKDSVLSYMDQVMQKFNLGVQDRIAALADIAHGRTTRKVKATKKNKEGEVIGTYETEIPVLEKDRLKAIDIANKMDGTYSKADSLNKIAEKEFEGFRKHLFRNVTPSTNSAEKIDCSHADVQSEGNSKGVSDVNESIK